MIYNLRDEKKRILTNVNIKVLQLKKELKTVKIASLQEISLLKKDLFKMVRDIISKHTQFVDSEGKAKTHQLKERITTLEDDL